MTPHPDRLSKHGGKHPEVVQVQQPDGGLKARELLADDRVADPAGVEIRVIDQRVAKLARMGADVLDAAISSASSRTTGGRTGRAASWSLRVSSGSTFDITGAACHAVEARRSSPDD
jgi:hypothetical protein